MFIGRKVHIMMSYLLLMTFYQWDPSTAILMEEVYGPLETMLKNKTPLVTFRVYLG